MRSPPGRVRPAGTADTVNLREHQLPPSPRSPLADQPTIGSFVVSISLCSLPWLPGGFRERPTSTMHRQRLPSLLSL
jgi:hypothetical protein